VKLQSRLQAHGGETASTEPDARSYPAEQSCKLVKRIRNRQNSWPFNFCSLASLGSRWEGRATGSLLATASTWVRFCERSLIRVWANDLTASLQLLSSASWPMEISELSPLMASATNSFSGLRTPGR